jgi:glycerophosphoryl diester phosphodiesterase
MQPQFTPVPVPLPLPLPDLFVKKAEAKAEARARVPSPSPLDNRPRTSDVSLMLEIQGHRGARGLKPENTLPSFEAALDAGATSIETDVHLTRDGVPVLTHDPIVSERLFRLIPGSDSPPPSPRLGIRTLTLDQLRGYRAERNPDSSRFPEQDALVTPLAQSFSATRGLDPFTPPTVADFIAFVAAYAADPGKTPEQRTRALTLRFDLELKRVPFHPEAIGDAFDGEGPGELETRLVEIVRAANVVDRTTVRSFDHRCVLAIGRMEPRLTRAVLIAGTAFVDPVAVVRQAEATIHCPDFTFLDAAQVRLLHAANMRVLPWTVNRPEDWARLIEWGVDGITTDYPDRLAGFLDRGPR